MTLDAIEDRYVSVAEFAQGVGIHLQSVQRLVQQGRIPSVRPPIFRGRKVLIERSVFEQWRTNYDPRPGRKQYPGEVSS